MKLKILIGILLFLIVLNLATIGSFVYFRFTRESRDYEGMPFSGRGRRGSFGKEGHPEMRLAREDREQLRDLLYDFGEETSNLKIRIHDLEDQTFEAMQEDPVSRERVDSLLEEIADTQLEISKKATEALISAKSVLSPEQQEMFYNAILRVRPSPPGMGPGFRNRHPPPPPEPPELP